jgi:cytochrome c oxidase subunit 2
MASVESPVTAPAPGWARRLPRDERIFMVLVVASAAFMSAFTIGWLVLGKQNPPTHSYRTSPAAFRAQVAEFTQKYKQADGLVHVPPGVDAYLMGQRYVWYPDLALKVGHTYRIWMSSGDALHGFSLVGHGQNINLEVAPNHAYGATFTPGAPGTYLIVCNEYCGLGHQAMQGRIVVER